MKKLPKIKLIFLIAVRPLFVFGRNVKVQKEKFDNTDGSYDFAQPKIIYPGN